jgi:hypothetical protein
VSAASALFASSDSTVSTTSSKLSRRLSIMMVCVGLLEDCNAKKFLSYEGVLGRSGEAR